MLFAFCLFQVRSSGSPLSPLLYGDPLGSPPPAHMGGLPYSLDPSRGNYPSRIIIILALNYHIIY